MTVPIKWWLISDEDVQAIKKGLTGSLLHTLESGLQLLMPLQVTFRVLSKQ